MAAERGVGVVTYYDPNSNFGFIDPDDASGDVVFALRPGDEPLAVGTHVDYDLIPQPVVTQMGKQALNVRPTGHRGALPPIANPDPITS
jgi:cold shock CspA family protein